MHGDLRQDSLALDLVNLDKLDVAGPTRTGKDCHDEGCTQTDLKENHRCDAVLKKNLSLAFKKL
jgi:hypothetical protein